MSLGTTFASSHCSFGTSNVRLEYRGSFLFASPPPVKAPILSEKVRSRVVSRHLRHSSVFFRKGRCLP